MSPKKELIPRNGLKMMVGIVARISGCPSQKEVSLEDQCDNIKETFGEMWEGPVEYIIISTKGKGENLERPELAEIEELLRSGILDFLFVEDLGRLIRGGEAARFCGVAVDHGTRVIAINDCIDTIEPEWEADVLAACSEHVGHNEHTSKRIKKKNMLRFKRSGGARAGLIYGYVLPEGGKTYFDVQKDPNPQTGENLKDGRNLLEETLNYSAVARMFNKRKVPGGPSRRKGEWDGASIKRLYHNSLLIGRPGRGFRRTKKRHANGRRPTEHNPDGPTYIDCPHLVYFTPEQIEPLIEKLKGTNACHSRVKNHQPDPRFRVPRKETRFPGQFGTCWYCGSHFVWGGNGITDNLMCARSREWKCWNSVGFNGPLFVERLMGKLFDCLNGLEGFDEQFRALVATSDGAQSVAHELKRLRHNEDELAREQKNILEAIVRYGPQDMFDERMAHVRQQAAVLKAERYRLEQMAHRKSDVPESPAGLRSRMEQSFLDLSESSAEFGRLLRKIVPQFHVYLVRLCDGGHPVARIQAQLDLSGICPDARLIDGLTPMLTSTVFVDGFERPQRERIREEAVRLIGEGCQQREACQRIEERPTQPALQRALKLHKKMQELGLDSPYLILRTPPDDYPKLRRFKAAHFRFEPCEGYVPPEIM